MCEFFRDWKRKVGIATLVMACAFAIAWIRSIYMVDYIQYNADAAMYGCGSEEQRVTFGSWSGNQWYTPAKSDPRWNWSATRITPESNETAAETLEQFEIDWKWGRCGFEFTNYTGKSNGVFPNNRYRMRKIPYWFVVLPLILLSAYLLLSRPRPQPKQPVPNA